MLYVGAISVPMEILMWEEALGIAFHAPWPPGPLALVQTYKNLAIHSLHPHTQDVDCECQEGYAGEARNEIFSHSLVSLSFLQDGS